MNPDALGDRRARSTANAQPDGSRGPLHGIPVCQGQHRDGRPDADHRGLAGARRRHRAATPTLVARLREAGAVILGKTNLSEWANIRSSHSTSGWSARGGLTRNPYALDRNAERLELRVGGRDRRLELRGGRASAPRPTARSSRPRSINGVVGLKPTVGLVSRDGIIPISHSQDTPARWARTVADAAMLLAAIAGADARDPATAAARARRLCDGPARQRTDGCPARRRSQRVRLEPGGGCRDRSRPATARGEGRRARRPRGAAYRLRASGGRADVLLTELKAGLAGWLARLHAAGAGPVAGRRDRVEQGSCGAGAALVRPGALREGADARRPEQPEYRARSPPAGASPATRESTRRFALTPSTRSSRRPAAPRG